MEGTDAGMRRGLRKAAYAGNRCRLPVTGTAERRVCGVSKRERALPGCGAYADCLSRNGHCQAARMRGVETGTGTAERVVRR